MTQAATSSFPAAAVDWLVGEPAGPVLALGRSAAPLIPHLAGRVPRLMVSDPSSAGVRALLNRAPLALPTVAEPDRLPFVPCAFDGIVVNQSFHALPPSATLPELARVLRPGGVLSISYTVRDDSVPWVRRLIKLLRSYDPQAMAGDYGLDSLAELTDSPFFPEAETRRFRLWVPISLEGLSALVERRFPALSPDRRVALLGQVEQLYTSSARPPEPLLLPYQVVCTRAAVDHSEFTSALHLPDDGLPITL